MVTYGTYSRCRTRLGSTGLIVIQSGLLSVVDATQELPESERLTGPEDDRQERLAGEAAAVINELSGARLHTAQQFDAPEGSRGRHGLV